MATDAQRAVAICDAVFNTSSTLAQQNLLVSAWCPNLPAEWTQAQKAGAFIREIIQESRRRHQQAIQKPGIESANAAAATQASSDIPD